MADRRGNAEGASASYKSTIKLTPAIGDWTMLRPVRPPSKKVKTGLYGFDRLSQEDLKSARLIHYNFAQALITSLKRDLSVGGELFTVSVEQSTYSDFLKKVFQPTAYSKIMIPNLGEPVIATIDMPLANTIINHALGGKDINPITRKLTEIEEEVLTKVFQTEIEQYAIAFERIFEMPKFSVANSPEIMIESSLSPSGTFVFFTIELSVGDNPPAMIWIGYTSSALKTLVDRFEKKKNQRQINFSKLPAALLDGVAIPVIADLGSTAVPTKDLHSIEVGDVVSVGTALGGFSGVYLGGGVELLGRAGTRNNRLSVRVFKNKPVMVPRHEMPSEVRAEMDENLGLENNKQQEYPVDEVSLDEDLLEEEEGESKSPGV